LRSALLGSEFGFGSRVSRPWFRDSVSIFGVSFWRVRVSGFGFVVSIFGGSGFRGFRVPGFGISGVTIDLLDSRGHETRSRGGPVCRVSGLGSGLWGFGFRV